MKMYEIKFLPKDHVDEGWKSLVNYPIFKKKEAEKMFNKASTDRRYMFKMNTLDVKLLSTRYRNI